MLFSGLAFFYTRGVSSNDKALSNSICYLVQFGSDYQYCRVNLPLLRSCFLATPKKQIKNMTNKKRIILTAIYLGMIILTLVLGILLPDNLTFIVFISLIGQIVAYFFYTLSYIPYGR